MEEFSGKKTQHPKLNAPDSRWKELPLLLIPAQNGDPVAMRKAWAITEPLVHTISNVPYFIHSLGKEEARSIATLSMLDFLHCVPPGTAWQDIPHKLQHAIKCDLINCIRRQTTRSHYEMHQADDTEEEESAELPADRHNEPERCLLEQDHNRRIRECLQYLGNREQQVIIGFYFRQLSVTEIASRLQCSVNSVSLAKRRALRKLRKLFMEKEIV